MCTATCLSNDPPDSCGLERVALVEKSGCLRRGAEAGGYGLAGEVEVRCGVRERWWTVVRSQTVRQMGELCFLQTRRSLFWASEVMMG